MAENWIKSKGELQLFFSVVLSKILWPLSIVFLFVSSRSLMERGQ